MTYREVHRHHTCQVRRIKHNQCILHRTDVSSHPQRASVGARFQSRPTGATPDCNLFALWSLAFHTTHGAGENATSMLKLVKNPDQLVKMFTLFLALWLIHKCKAPYTFVLLISNVLWIIQYPLVAGRTKNVDSLWDPGPSTALKYIKQNGRQRWGNVLLKHIVYRPL